MEASPPRITGSSPTRCTTSGSSASSTRPIAHADDTSRTGLSDGRTVVEVDDPHAELLDLGKPARRPGRNHHAERNLLEEADQRPVVGERQPVLRHQQQDLAAQLSERIGAWRTPLRCRPPLVAHGLAPAGPTSCRNLLPACGRVELLPLPTRIGLWTPMAPYRLQTSRPRLAELLPLQAVGPSAARNVPASTATVIAPSSRCSSSTFRNRPLLPYHPRRPAPRSAPAIRNAPLLRICK